MVVSKSFKFDLLPRLLKESTYDWCHLNECLRMLSTNRSLRMISLSRGPFTRRLNEIDFFFVQKGVSNEPTRCLARKLGIHLRTDDFSGDPLASLPCVLLNEGSLDKKMNPYRLLISTIRYCPTINISHHTLEFASVPPSTNPIRDVTEEVWLDEFIPQIKHLRLLSLSDFGGSLLVQTPRLFHHLLTIEEARLHLTLFRPWIFWAETVSDGIRQLITRALIPRNCNLLTFQPWFKEVPMIQVFDNHPIAISIIGGGVGCGLADWHWAIKDLVSSERNLGRPLDVIGIDLRCKVDPKETTPWNQYNYLLSAMVLGNQHDLALQEITDEMEVPEKIKKKISLHQPIEWLDSRVWQPSFSMDHSIGCRRFYVFQAFLDESGNTWFNFWPLLA